MTPPTFTRLTSPISFKNVISTAGIFWTVCAEIERSYLCMCMILVMIFLTLILPDISQKHQMNRKMKDMQQILNIISTEVDRAEVACVTMADDMYWLRCNVCDNSTETDITKNLHDLAVCTSKVLTMTRSEPVQVEKKTGFFRKIFFPHRNVSNKEITLMSYVYTDSFDGINND